MDMIDRHRETVKFNTAIDALAARLSNLGVTIVEREYAAEAFGSWHIVAGTDKKKIDFAYDGKESYLMHRDTATGPKDHRDFTHKLFKTWEGEDPVAYIETVLTQEFEPRNK